jgi:Xaa-Pro dipeptidase
MVRPRDRSGEEPGFDHRARLEQFAAALERAGIAAALISQPQDAGLVAQRRWDAALQPEGAIASGPLLATMSGGPITVSGVGLTAATPFGASTRRLERGDLLNIDLGVNVRGYHGDLARTYVLGEPSDEIVRLAGIVRELEDALLAELRPGVSAASVYRRGIWLAQELGVADVFQGHSGTYGPYVGHGIGLELDEPPVFGPRDETTLAAGMVLAVEPKLISPAFGAVNLEDDVVVTADGCELLGSVPRSVFAVDGRGGVEPLTPEPATAGWPARTAEARV